MVLWCYKITYTQCILILLAVVNKLCRRTESDFKDNHPNKTGIILIHSKFDTDDKNSFCNKILCCPEVKRALFFIQQ